MKHKKHLPTSAFNDASDLELFEYLLEEEDIEIPVGDIIPRIETHGPVPLSFSQQRMWFLEQMEPGRPTYNVSGALRLKGALDIQQLSRSLNEIVRRHEALRTTFTTVDTTPTQVIHESLTLAMPVEDISNLPESEREAEAKRIAFDEARLPFDLHNGPLIRARLLHLAHHQHVLLVTLHHIICDGWSIAIIIRDLAALYDSFLTGLPPSLTDVLTQYSDYAAWQRHHLQGHLLVSQLDYWKQQLSGELPVISLPLDRPRPPVQTFAGASVEREIGTEVLNGLKRVAGQESATLFMSLLAAFGVLLGRYSNQQEVVVGTPVANRNHRQIEGTVGFFVNTLVMRVGLRRKDTYRDVLRRVRETAIGAYEHQEVPFEKLVEELRPERGLSHSPLFQVAFALQDDWMPTIELESLRMIPFEINASTSKFDLSLEMRESEDGLIAALEYKTDIFEEATAKRMLLHYEALLESIVENPDRRLRDMSVLTCGERRQIIEEWNQTETEYPYKTIHELFEQQAERKPEATALEFEGERVSYRELNRRANQLAQYLIRHGAGPEDCLGISMERSVDMVVGLLAILKSGAAYVPLDPAYPKERLDFMLSDSGVRLVLTEQRFAETFHEWDATPISIDAEWNKIAAESGSNPVTKVSPENLVYVIYTSGSTGRPKGVLLQHGGVVNCLTWLRENFALDESDRVVFKAALSFDASVWELFLPLTHGATVIIARPKGEQDADYLVSLIRESNVTTIHFIPSMFSVFLDQEGLEQITSLKRISCGGEALSAESVERAFDRLKAELHNFYGPTEASIGCINWRCEPGRARRSVPIGRPINNTRAYILDENLQPVPIGVTGELFIGGEGLARGYLNNPHLTADRFLPDLFTNQAGSRLYRSGDMARYLADGTIDFLGRADDQVKVRGFRIEPGEIETALSSHHAVRESLVLLREDAPGDKRLVAYVVSDETAQTDGKELRNFLRGKLPDYMVPSAFVMLERMPLNSNGKVDRRALPEPDRARQGAEESYVAARNPLEEVLAAIWADVLGLERISVFDNFFELGGHSLLAMQAAARIHTALHLEVPVRRLFECPTVEGLAETLQLQVTASRSVEAPPLEPVPREAVMPASFAQRRLWFLDQLETEKSVYNMAAARRLIGQLNVEAIERALSEIVRRHEALRTTFTMSEGVAAQVIHPAEPARLPVVDLSRVPETEREARAQALACDEARRPFDLGRWPLVRAMLFRLREDDHVLVVTMHHIVSDGWSMGVLTEELAALYTAFSKGEPSPLAELPIQYADFVAWQREALKGEALKAHLEYWGRQLGGELSPLELPADRPRSQAQSFRGAVLNFNLPREISGQLKALSQREGVTLYMTLLAAFQALLSRYTGQQDVSVGSPIANRNHPALERLIGFFANTLVMRTDLSGNPTFKVLLDRVRKVSLEAYAHQDLPLERVVEELQPIRDLSHSPLFQVLFVLQNAPQDEFKLPGLASQHIDVHAGMAHFDLTLSMTEEAGQLIGTFEYKTDLFDEPTIRRMADNLEELLKSALADPDRQVSSLSILTEAERYKLLVECNAGHADYADHACIHKMFERQVERTPDEGAVEFEGTRLTYRELNGRANRLAHHLRKVGAGPDVLVGLCLERGLDAVTGLLGILKAGAAYVPLDATYPKQRLALMLEGAQLVLTDRRLISALPECESKVICLDEIADRLAEQRPEDPINETGPDNLAYVVYTSGSTGLPKGVAMNHRAVANMIGWQLQSSRASVGTRTLQFASLSFDVSFQEIISTLCSGGTLVLISEELRRDDQRLMRFLTDAEIERLFVPFVMLQQLAERAETEQSPPKSLREVMTAGEQLKITPQIESFFASLPGCTLYNHYGPSETHAATWLTLEGAPARWSRLPSIGRRLPHAQMYILDGELQPVPLGVIGELYIGGYGLARGYHARPELTAERFIPDPFSREPGARLYRTGDLARYLADGNIEFFGRKDDQVKIRGFRVEPGEIETALRQHPGLREAVVAAWEHRPGEKRLVAYVIPANSASVSNVELRSFLKQRLPDYMVPSGFLVLDELPLTRSGKVDRRALPAPDSGHFDSDSDHAAPRNQTEEVIAEIWADVLGVERVGINDNFFDLGGHSLMAARLISRLRDALRIELPLRRLFEEPTVAELAESIWAEIKADKCVEAPTPLRIRKQAGLPLSFAQERMWFLNRLNPHSAAYNMPAALRLTGRLNPAALEESLNRIIGRHESLRTTFKVVEGRPVQIIHDEQAIGLAITDLQHLQESEREAEAKRIAFEEARLPFDLHNGPLVRARLLALGQQQHVLLVTFHHIICDGWSIGIIIRELAALYEALSKRAVPQLPEVRLQYADYAVWQRRWLEAEGLERQLRYWREQLAGELPVMSLPLDRPRAPIQSFTGASVERHISSQLLDGLKRVSRSESATLFMSLLAAFNVLLGRYSGQQEVVVGTPVANRNHSEVEGSVGLFVNTLVMRVGLGVGDRYRDVLRKVREVALGAYNHQDIPFEKLVEELRPERDLSHSPLFQVAFALQNAPMPPIELSGLSLKPLEVESEVVKFDLTLSLEETQQGLNAVLQYSSDLFEEATAKRMLEHYNVLLEAIVADPNRRVSELPILQQAERQQILEGWNDTKRDYPQGKCINHLFEDRAERTPYALAVSFQGVHLSYEELDRQANQLARHLQSLGVRRGALVGVLLERSHNMVLAVLAIIKAGGAYVPLDADWPSGRMTWILSSLNVTSLLTQNSMLRAIHELEWKLPRLANVICLDCNEPRPAPELLDTKVVEGLWDELAERAHDRVSAGGFINSYTGEPFSEQEVDEYVSRVVNLARAYVAADKRVLEIGCGAGLIMFELAPDAGHYVGLDPSELTQSRNREFAAEHAYSNVELVTGFAHEVGAMDPASVDLVIIASTAQFFPGPAYMSDVIEKSLRLLTPGGMLLLADVMDARRKDDFKRSLLEFKSEHAQARTKTRLESELYFDEDFFHDLRAELQQIAGVRVLHRDSGFSNELGYRYDVLISKRASDQEADESKGRAERKKNLQTRWHTSGFSAEPPAPSATPDDIAYIIFTSGSTGLPKGVIVRHSSVVNLIDWVNSSHAVGPQDRLLFVTSLCFDLSVYDIFGILAAGGTIQVASRTDLREPKRLAEILSNEKITFWDSAPAALQQLVPFFSPAETINGGGSLRLVFLSGDWIPLSLPDEVRAVFPRAQVISLGGATEATVWSNTYPIEEVQPHWASVPYGKPIQNARYHILDPHLNPCPVNVPGDLYIGGDCLAIGYTDGELTAEKFIPDPFTRTPGERLYKTGDMARYLADGNIEFLGRNDNQVKIRGFRIELGEIEAVLGRHAAVSEALVMAREDVPGDKRLVAYVVAKPEQNIGASELRSHMKERLPDYMLPSAILMLKEMPLTRNGKVDRKRLPKPDGLRPESEEGFIAPANELERTIATIWQDVLQVDRVARHDNFFDLGGHSLKMARVHSRLQEVLNKELSMIELFKFPTVNSLAQHLTRDSGEPEVSRQNQERGKARRESVAERARMKQLKQAKGREKRNPTAGSLNSREPAS